LDHRQSRSLRYRQADGARGIVILPYSVELNEIPAMLVQHHQSDYWQQRCVEAFDRPYAEGAERPRVMAIAILPYISGQPHRIRYLEAVYDSINSHADVVHWNGAEMLDWCLGEHGSGSGSVDCGFIPSARLGCRAIRRARRRWGLWPSH
jgi:hypothetical protein